MLHLPRQSQHGSETTILGNVRSNSTLGIIYSQQSLENSQKGLVCSISAKMVNNIFIERENIGVENEDEVKMEPIII